jgi:hypothetical protein
MRKILPHGKASASQKKNDDVVEDFHFSLLAHCGSFSRNLPDSRAEHCTNFHDDNADRHSSKPFLANSNAYRHSSAANAHNSNALQRAHYDYVRTFRCTFLRRPDASASGQTDPTA